MRMLEELDAAVLALQATVAAQASTIAAQAIEIQRAKDMVQTLSESHDLNRRELQAATKGARDVTTELEQHVTKADTLARELAEEKATRPK